MESNSNAADDGPVLVYATFPDIDQARATAGRLVEDRLAACVNILPQMVSVYRWDGAVAEDREVVLIAKTRHGLGRAVTDAITDSHPYDLPAVLILPVGGGHAPFCRWILSETAGATDPRTTASRR